MAGFGLADAPEQREAEGEGLARAGLGLAEDVAPGEASAMVSSWMGKGSVMPWREGSDEIGMEAEPREGCGHWGIARFRHGRIDQLARGARHLR